MKTICENTVTEEMIIVGGALISRLLSSYDVVGGWDADEVLPDVFRAMISVAPEVQHEKSPTVPAFQNP